MTNERVAELIDKVQKADTFEKLREFASDATSTELREVFKELTETTSMH